MQRIILLLIMIFASGSLAAQYELEYLGLSNQAITSFDINFNIASTGTDRNGVYWQFENTATETGWSNIAMDSSVLAVYPHKSGPIGWAISAGIDPLTGDPPYVFCSEMGGTFNANSTGFIPSLTFAVTDLDGFPDLTICGETYAAGGRALYRRNIGDTTWQVVFTATIEGFIHTVKVRESHPGVVMLGGADGFAGILLARSLDFGESWQDLSPFGPALGIDFGGANGDTIFVAASHAIFRTFDGGTIWETVFQDGIAMHLTEILYFHEQAVVYAAGRQNVMSDDALLLVSYDLGENWDIVPLPDLGRINGLEAGSEDWIYFSTRDDGVYRLRESATGTPGSWEQDQSDLWLRCFPNPAGVHGSIEYGVSQNGRVKIAVMNSSGQTVMTLLDTIRPAGTYRQQWDPSVLPAGLYYLVINSSGKTVTERVVVSGK